MRSLLIGCARSVWTGLIWYGMCQSNLHPQDVEQALRRLHRPARPARLDAPAPGHPERLGPARPLSPGERELWAHLDLRPQPRNSR